MVKVITPFEEAQRGEQNQERLKSMVKETSLVLSNLQTKYELYRPKGGSWFSVSEKGSRNKPLYVFPYENKAILEEAKLSKLANYLASSFESSSGIEFTIVESY